jgi:membrane protein implicated in regulation of membrane protease activity
LDTVFDAGLHLPILAAFFDLTVIIVLVLLMWWNARLFRNIEREDDRRQQQLHQEMQSILRDVVRGKPRER